MAARIGTSREVVRRALAVSLFLAGWMACGWLLRLDGTAYLVLGVPLTVGFQRYVRRQPLRALWVREVPPFRLRGWGMALAAVLAVLPLLGLAGSAVDRDGAAALYSLLGLVGAVGAAYSLRHLRREHLRPLAMCLLITSALDTVQWLIFLSLGVVEMGPVEGGLPGRAVIGVASLLQLLAVVFVMEEVSFRMLDTHVFEAAGRPGVVSAVLISAAWGLWHLPIMDEPVTWTTIPLLLYVHVPYGVCLSLYWRKTGNLFVPGLCHALGDAVREAIAAS